MASNIRLFINTPIEKAARLTISGNQRNYLINVMRKKLSDKVNIFNGKDGEWQSEISYVAKKEVQLSVLKKIREQKGESDVWLIFAPIKVGRIDYLVEKATELGVAKLLPVFTERTIVNKVNTERLSANCMEAAEQSERLSVPEIAEPVKLSKLIEKWDKNRKIILCDESGGGNSIKETMINLKSGSYAIMIGPEGGFTKRELEMLKSLSYIIPVGLGPRVMRADTAAIAALTSFQQHLGDWDEAPRFKG